MPGRLLAAVLERVEREVGEPRDLRLGRVYAEDAALVARSVAIVERVGHEEVTGPPRVPAVVAVAATLTGRVNQVRVVTTARPRGARTEVLDAAHSVWTAAHRPW